MALTLPAVILPVTANEVSVPTLVILVCAAVERVPVNTAPRLPNVPAVTVEAVTVVNLPVAWDTLPITVLLIAANEATLLDTKLPDKLTFPLMVALPETDKFPAMVKLARVPNPVMLGW